MDSATRTFFEPRFSHDFSHVRVHSDVQAAESARAAGALAYTQGSHLTFGAGRFSPQTPAGLHLLAHELTHVVQQRSATPRTGAPGSFEPAAEAEAERTASAVVRGERVAAILERSAGAAQRSPDPNVNPAISTPTEARRGSTDPIGTAYGAGTLDKEGWSRLVQTAKTAYEEKKTETAASAYRSLLLDAAELAQASRVLSPANDPNWVRESAEAGKGLKPGLNFSLDDGHSVNADAQTGFVNLQGEFSPLSFTDDVPQPQVATVLYRGAFASDKEFTLAILRHEMTHARHDEQALAAVRTWLKKAPKPKGDQTKLSPKARFVNWLRAQPGAGGLESVLTEESAGATTTVGSPNTEVLAHVEGFVTAFHLVTPPPADPNHPIFLELLGAEGRWAPADRGVRTAALGRLQVYYCHGLDQPHRKSFKDWIASRAASATRDPSGMRQNFVQGLKTIVAGPCKGPDSKAPAPGHPREPR